MTSYVLRKGSAERTGTDVVVIGLLTTGDGPVVAAGGEGVEKAFGRRWKPMLSVLGASGKAGEAVSVPTAGTIKAPVLLLVGLGDAVDPTTVRRAAGVAARSLHNAASVALALPADEAALVRAATEGYALGGYVFDQYRTTPSPERPGEVVVLSEAARRREASAAFEEAQVVAAAVALARDWVNTPAQDLTPELFADTIAEHARKRRGRGPGRGSGKVKVRVFDEAELQERGCGGILGVGKASASPPRMVQLTYEPKNAAGHLALVGKGVTYDSGGLSLKPGASMMTMKLDMAGAAAVVAATFAIADLGLPVRITTFAPMAENMVSGSATRPGDVLTMYGGRTVEVLNTDAEGRLLLADALGHAVEAKPDLVVDVATLTGACVVALGERVSGVFGNDTDTVDRVVRSAARAGEAAWPMPIPEEMVEKVRTNSKVADLAQHNTERWGGACYAAAFLQEFVGDLLWSHVDIAGPAFNEKSAYGHVTPGGTGAAVSTLVELARELGTPS